MKELDRRGGLGLGGELNEREPPGPPRLAIRRQVDLDDVACLGQERGQRVGGGAEGEVPDEDTGSDGWFPPDSLRARSFRLSAMVPSVALTAGFAGQCGGPDLLGEHAHVEWTWRRVRLDVLAVRLVALDEVASRPHQAVQPRQPDEHVLGHDGTPEFAGTRTA